MSVDTADKAALPPAAKASSPWPWLFATVVVLAGGGGAAAWFLGVFDRPAATQAVVEAPKKPIYYTLDENLVVNFRGPTGARYLQVGIDLMTYDAATVTALDAHKPVLRNNLILLLSDQKYEELTTREGKEVLQQTALAEVQEALTTLASNARVESLYFTSFVMQ